MIMALSNRDNVAAIRLVWVCMRMGRYFGRGIHDFGSDRRRRPRSCYDLKGFDSLPQLSNRYSHELKGFKCLVNECSHITLQVYVIHVYLC